MVKVISLCSGSSRSTDKSTEKMRPRTRMGNGPGGICLGSRNSQLGISEPLQLRCGASSVAQANTHPGAQERGQHSKQSSRQNLWLFPSLEVRACCQWLSPNWNESLPHRPSRPAHPPGVVARVEEEGEAVVNEVHNRADYLRVQGRLFCRRWPGNCADA